MSALRWLPMVVVFVLACGDSSNEAGAGLQNVASDGTYGFNGVGWTAGDSSHWTFAGPPARQLTRGGGCTSGLTVQACAQRDRTTLGSGSNPTATTDLGQLADTSAYWFSFVSFDGSNVYEAYFPKPDGSYKFEMSGKSLSVSDASATLKTVRVLK